MNCDHEAGRYITKLQLNWINSTSIYESHPPRVIPSTTKHRFYALQGMVPEMIASLEIMLERWRHHHSKEIDIFVEFKILTSEVISRTSFGSSYLEGQHVFDMLTRMTHIISENNYRVRIPGIG